MSDAGLVSFTAHYEGARMGIGLNCVIEDAPPHGAWTAVRRVVCQGAPHQTAVGAAKLIG